MIKYKLRKNNNSHSPKTFNKWYPTPVISETLGVKQLAAHMAKHNTPFSEGTITGILTDMVDCIRELCLEGNAIKIDNLAIFSVGIVSTGGVADPADFNAAKHIKDYRLRARATGEFTRKQLGIDATARETAKNSVDTTKKTTNTTNTTGD